MILTLQTLITLEYCISWFSANCSTDFSRIKNKTYSSTSNEAINTGSRAQKI